MPQSYKTQIAQRLASGAESEFSVPNTQNYERLDQRLGVELDAAMAAKCENMAKKDSMLITEEVCNDMLQILEAAFPAFNKVYHTLGKSSGADVEMLRNCMVRDVVQNEAAGLDLVHLGGYVDMHLPYGARVHCEAPEDTAQAVRRKTSHAMTLEMLYRDYGSLCAKMPRNRPRWDDYGEYLRGVGGFSCSCPAKCTAPAEHMLIDVNMLGMSQEQACAAMIQHDCSVASVLLLVEDSSLYGGAGYVLGTRVMAEYESESGYIRYRTDDGVGVDFPDVPKDLLLEWLTVSCRQEFGHTFTFEIVHVVGAFVRVKMIRVPGLRGMTVRHALWDVNSHGAERVRVVKAPKLKDLTRTRGKGAYEEYTALISERTYAAARDYAFSLKDGDFTRQAIRKKLNEVNNRVVVKGTSVSIREALAPDVVEAVALEIYVKTYVENFAASQTFKGVIETTQAAARFDANSMWVQLGLAARNAGVAWYRNCTESAWKAAHEQFDQIIMRRLSAVSCGSAIKPKYTEYTTVLHAGGVRTRWHNILITMAGGALVALKRSRPRGRYAQDEEPPDSPVRSRSYQGAASTTVEETEESVEGAEFMLLRPETVDNPENQLELHSMPEETRSAVAQVMACADQGAPDQVAVETVTTYVPVFDVADNGGQRLRENFSVEEAITVINDQYANAFPMVANADMSGDYGLAAYGANDFVIEAAYMRMPIDRCVGSERVVYKSRLRGPGRPSAPTNAVNMLFAVNKRNLAPNVLKTPQPYNIEDQMLARWLESRCKPEAKQMLLDYQANKIGVTESNLIRWALRTPPDKVARVADALEKLDQFMSEFDLSEFNLQFKGKVKPTLSANASAAYAKFQTIMHYAPELNVFWTAMFSDLTSRYNALLKQNVLVGVRGNDEDKLDFLRTRHPWGNKALTYVQIDMSEYDKSQEGRARTFFDKLHHMLGMSEVHVKEWSHGQHYNTARCMALGMKLVVPLQMKSGVATTLWGNSAYSQAIAAWMMPNFVYEMGQGDDLYTVLESSDFRPDNIVRVAADVFNMPVKLISQCIMATRIGYFCGKFVVYDERLKRVCLLPDPMKAVESLSRPLTTDEAKFEEMFASFQDRMAAWKTDFNTIEFNRMVKTWYQSVDLDATRLVDALISCGKIRLDFKKIWEEDPDKLI